MGVLGRISKFIEVAIDVLFTLNLWLAALLALRNNVIFDDGDIILLALVLPLFVKVMMLSLKLAKIERNGKN